MAWRVSGVPIFSWKGQRSRSQDVTKTKRASCLLTDGRSRSGADRRLQTTPTALLGLIYCRRGAWVWDARQLDGRPHVMSALGGDMPSWTALFSPLSLTLKLYVTLNYHFTLNSVFAQVRLELFVVDFENNFIKTNKHKPILSAATRVTQPETLVSGNIRLMRKQLNKILTINCLFKLIAASRGFDAIARVSCFTHVTTSQEIPLKLFARFAEYF